MKKFVSILLTLILSFNFLPTTAFAYSGDINDDYGNILNSEFYEREFEKTFNLPSISEINASGITVLQQTLGYGAYSCNIRYLPAETIFVIDTEGNETEISGNKYFYVLIIGSNTPQFKSWTTKPDDTSSEFFAGLYDNSLAYNQYSLSAMISEDGKTWYSLDRNRNTDQEMSQATVGPDNNINGSAYGGSRASLCNIMFASPDFYSKYPFATAQSLSSLYSYYLYYNRSLYQFGETKYTPNSSDLTANSISYPVEGGDVVVHVPYDITYLNSSSDSNNGNTDVDVSLPVVWWTSLGNKYTSNNETDIYTVKNLTQITLGLYTGDLVGQKYALCVYEWLPEDQELKHITFIDFYKNQTLNPRSTYLAQINLQDKLSMSSDKIYCLAMGYSDKLYFGDDFKLITPPIFVTPENSFSKSGIYDSTLNDKYSNGILGYPEDPNNYLTGDIDSIEVPKLPDNIDINDNAGGFDADTPFESINNLVNYLVDSFNNFLEAFTNLINNFVNLLLKFISHIQTIGEMIKMIFSFLPAELQDVISLIFYSFGLFIMIRLFLKLFGR